MVLSMLAGADHVKAAGRLAGLGGPDAGTMAIETDDASGHHPVPLR
jgi:hypothetical protein